MHSRNEIAVMRRTNPITILILLLWSLSPLSAQTNRGGISGTIFDPSGAPVPHAQVLVTNIGTNQTTTLTASADGNYEATLLEPVTYRITVEVPGFAKSVLEGVKVDTSTTSTVNITLRVGAVSDQVTISADTVQ